MRALQETVLDGTFTSADLGVKMQYPTLWERSDLVKSTPPLTLVVMFLSPRETSSDVRENVNLVTEKLPSALTLPEYTDLGIAIERGFFSQYTLRISDDIVIAGVYRSHRVIFTATLSGGKMTFEQIWMVRGKTAYVWTFADTAEKFDEHVGTFERMLDTLVMQ